MKRQRIIAGLTALFLIFTLLSGCSALEKESEEETPKKQLYFYYPYDSSYVIKSLILEFNNSQDRIIVEGIEGSGQRKEFLEKLDELIKKGQTVPDIILIHDTWLAKLAAEQKIQPLDGGLSIEKRNKIFAGMADAMVWEGKTYGWPFWQDMPLLYYRTDLVETPPAAWEDLFQLALQIMKANEMEYGLVFPGSAEENAAAFLAGIWHYFGTYPDFEAEETVFDQESVANVWNFMVSMAREEVISLNSMSMDPENCRAVFEAGNAAFMWNWSYAARLFLDEESPLYGKVGVASLPAPGNVDAAGGILSGYVLTMSRATKSIPESWEFIQFLVSEQSQQRIKNAGLMPADASVYQSDWLEEIGLPSQFKDMMQKGQALKPGKNVNGTLNVMAEAVSLAFEHNKNLEDFILLLKEGIVEEEQVDETEPEEETDKESSESEESEGSGEESANPAEDTGNSE